jgi:antitoxin component of RelBE/YafQ-DinJ toxin-antitoxin module
MQQMSTYVTNQQVKVTLNKALTEERDRFSDRLGLPPSSVVKFTLRKFAQAELRQNELYQKIASSNNSLEEAA